MLREVFFSISHSAEDIMTTKKNHTICGFKSGIVNIFPLVIDRPKWNQEKENMKENNLNYIWFEVNSWLEIWQGLVTRWLIVTGKSES